MPYLRTPSRAAILAGLMALLVVTGCSVSSPAQESAPAITVPLQVSPVVSATGEVVPATWTTLSFQQPGRVVELLVEEGDVVEAGQIIARLDSTELKAQLTQVEISLLAAEARLAQIEAGPREQEVEAAKQALAAAQARIAAAIARKEQLYSQVTEAQIIDAETALKEAQKKLEDLQAAMEDLLDTDVSQYDPDEPNPVAEGQMLAWEIELAQLEVEAAQAYLNDLLDGPHPDDLKVANARIWLASAQAAAYKAQLDLLLAGPSAEDVAIARAEIEQAAADVAVTKARLGQVEMKAPFAGTITDVFIDLNAYVAPGQNIVQIADLTTLRVETTDLNEIDVARVRTGDIVTVTFDALPDVEIKGTVMRIAPKASEGAGVNFTVVIVLDSLPEALRWGMTAFVDIQVR